MVDFKFMVDFKSMLVPDGSLVVTNWGERGIVDHRARKHHGHICYRPLKNKLRKQHVLHGFYAILVRGDHEMLK